MVKAKRSRRGGLGFLNTRILALGKHSDYDSLWIESIVFPYLTLPPVRGTRCAVCHGWMRHRQLAGASPIAQIATRERNRREFTPSVLPSLRETNPAAGRSLRPGANLHSGACRLPPRISRATAVVSPRPAHEPLVVVHDHQCRHPRPHWRSRRSPPGDAAGRSRLPSAGGKCLDAAGPGGLLHRTGAVHSGRCRPAEWGEAPGLTAEAACATGGRCGMPDGPLLLVRQAWFARNTAPRNL